MGHIAANCRATWEQVEPKRGGPQQTVPSRPNPHVSYLDGEVGLPAQPSATTSAAPAADPVLQFGTIPARINMMGSAQEPVPLSVFGLNMMAPSQLKDACIQEPVPLQTFGLTSQGERGHPSPPGNQTSSWSPRRTSHPPYRRER